MMPRCALHQSCRSWTTRGAGSSSLGSARTFRSLPVPEDTRPDLPDLLDTLATLKAQGRKPTRTAYGDLLRLAAQTHRLRSQPIAQGTEPPNSFPSNGLAWTLANASMEDARRGAVDLSASEFDHLLRFTQNHPATLRDILQQLPHSATENSGTLVRLGHIAIQNSNLDSLLPILIEMLNRGFVDKDVLTHAIRLCCDLGLARLALDITEQYEALSDLGLRAPSGVWSRVLRASADSCLYSGVERAWSRTKVHADEGLLVSVMNVAARSGKPEMVSQALEALPGDPREHHLVALLEAYVNAGQVPQALQVLATIRAAGLTPTSVTAQPIVAVLQSTVIVDQAFWALEDMKARGEQIDVTALNVVIEASAKLGDLQRVRATQMAASDLGIHLDTDSYNQVLAACASTKNRKLADTVLKEMSAAGIKADGTTYHHMIMCCLSQASYEDAFFFLEKSKSEGFKPSIEAYRRLASKCEANGDARTRLVIDEADELGYKVRPIRRRSRGGGETGQREGVDGRSQ